MLRSFGAVLLGLAIIGGVSSGVDIALRMIVPNAFGAGGTIDNTPGLVFTLAYVAALTVLGSYVSARLARSQPLRHALIVGALAFVWNLAGSIMKADAVPLWFHAVVLTMVLPCAWLGGRMRATQVQRAEEERTVRIVWRV